MYDIFEGLLKQKGLRANDVAKATGISTSTLTDWKKGRTTPKADKLQKIADFLGVSVDYLMTGIIKEAPSYDEEAMHVLELYNSVTPEIQKAVITLLEGAKSNP